MECQHFSYFSNRFNITNIREKPNILKFKQEELVSGAGTAYPSGTPEFTTGFSGVRVTRSLALCVCYV
jgi:hypothetical protein